MIDTNDITITNHKLDDFFSSPFRFRVGYEPKIEQYVLKYGFGDVFSMEVVKDMLEVLIKLNKKKK